LVKAYIKAGDPVISVDTKKKELLGEFRNTGRTWRDRGEPVKVNVHDFLLPALDGAAVGKTGTGGVALRPC
jgi:hypothetical protein